MYGNVPPHAENPPNFPHSEDEANYLRTILVSLTLRFSAEESLVQIRPAQLKSLLFQSFPQTLQASELYAAVEIRESCA